MAKRVSTKALTANLKKMLALRDRGRECYRDADAIMARLKDEMKLGVPIDLGGGEQAMLVDNFAERDKVFRQCGVARFEVKVSRAAQA